MKDLIFYGLISLFVVYLFVKMVLKFEPVRVAWKEIKKRLAELLKKKVTGAPRWLKTMSVASLLMLIMTIGIWLLGPGFMGIAIGTTQYWGVVFFVITIPTALSFISTKVAVVGSTIVIVLAVLVAIFIPKNFFSDKSKAAFEKATGVQTTIPVSTTTPNVGSSGTQKLPERIQHASDVYDERGRLIEYGRFTFKAPKANLEREKGWSIEIDTRGECVRLPDGSFKIGHYTRPDLINTSSGMPKYQFRFRRVDQSKPVEVAFDKDYHNTKHLPISVSNPRTAGVFQFRSLLDEEVEMIGYWRLVE